MPNPLFNIFGRNNQNGSMFGGPFGNMMNMISRFNQFKQNFQGDPRAQVQHLLDTGQMSPEQFEQLKSMAEQFQNMTRR